MTNPLLSESHYLQKASTSLSSLIKKSDCPPSLFFFLDFALFYFFLYKMKIKKIWNPQKQKFSGKKKF